jgi:hypothetical protein
MAKAENPVDLFSRVSSVHRRFFRFLQRTLDSIGIWHCGSRRDLVSESRESRYPARVLYRMWGGQLNMLTAERVTSCTDGVDWWWVSHGAGGFIRPSSVPTRRTHGDGIT